MAVTKRLASSISFYNGFFHTHKLPATTVAQSSQLQTNLFSKRYCSNYTTLPLLNTLISYSLAKEKQPPLKDTAIVCLQQTFGTTIPLIQSFIKLGAEPSDIFVTGKYYSEVPEVAKKISALGVYYRNASKPVQLGGFRYAAQRDVDLIWEKCAANLKKKRIKRIIVLDHGGRLLSSTPCEIFEKYPVIGVEKTNAGIIDSANYGMPFPLIEVASSAAKLVLESPLIANSVVDELMLISPIKTTNSVCGVIGCGSIGKALATKLLDIGRKIVVYDKDISKAKSLNGALVKTSLPLLIADSDYIFSCTGLDIGNLDAFKESIRDKVLISCSSEDKEFLSLLLFLRKELNGIINYSKLLDDIEYTNNFGAKIKLVRGGYPVNFNNKDENISPNDIQLTRALALGGVLDAIEMFKQSNLLNTPGSYMLNPCLQKFIVKEWLKCQPQDCFSRDTINNFDSEAWIKKHSGGACIPYNECSSLPSRDPHLLRLAK